MLIVHRLKRYHKQFFHGISSVSGKEFVQPLETRWVDQDLVEGLCHQCHTWVAVSNVKRKNSVLWYRHAHKVSKYLCYIIHHDIHLYSIASVTSITNRNQMYQRKDKLTVNKADKEKRAKKTKKSVRIYLSCKNHRKQHTFLLYLLHISLFLFFIVQVSYNSSSYITIFFFFSFFFISQMYMYI